jgi:hypothetical protein
MENNKMKYCYFIKCLEQCCEWEQYLTMMEVMRYCRKYQILEKIK